MYVTAPKLVKVSNSLKYPTKLITYSVHVLRINLKPELVTIRFTTAGVILLSFQRKCFLTSAGKGVSDT